MYLEAISLVGGALSGFLFKYMAQAQADRQANFERLIKERQEADNSADKASKRDDSRAGQITRRFIVICILFGLIVAPFILALFDLATIVQIETPVRSWLFGLIQSGGHTKFYEIHGYLLSPTLSYCAIAIVSFYFGQSAAKRG